MPTILSHPAVPLAIGLGLGRLRISLRLLLVAVFASIAPDFDVISFHLGIDYSHQLGHRGFTHSIFFAVTLGILALLFAKLLKTNRSKAFFFVTLAAASHGLLDMCTNGGLGIAYFWPVTDTRYFLPTRPILVSPLNLQRFLEARGLAVIVSELKWVWLPAISLCILLRLFFKNKCSKIKE